MTVSPLRVLTLVIFVLALLLGVSVFVPGSMSNYLALSAYFQLELLYGRVPLDEAKAAGHFNDKQLEKLELVPRIKEYGKSIGLKATANYSTINPTWKRKIWNVSATDPLCFKARKYRFPIVGKVPYLGFFRRSDAAVFERRLQARGLDVYVRTAGAYSTLGWFEDPLTPPMLNWSERSLANTLLHELTHATVWVPGSVKFNESFANFVGNEAGKRYIAHTYGDDSKEALAIGQGKQAGARWKEMMHGVYTELDAIYMDRSLKKGEKLQRKHQILASIPTRVAALDIDERNKKRFLKVARKGPWNNARLMGFKRYNSKDSDFRVLLDQEDGDLMRFIYRVEEITKGADDPFAAVREAIGREPPEREKRREKKCRSRKRRKR